MKYTTLDKICENLDYMRKPITGKDRIEGSIPYYGASGVVDHVKDYIFDEELLLISEDGANLLARTTPIAFSIRGKTWVNNHAHVLRFSDKKLQRFVELYLNGIKLDSYITGTAQPKLNQKMLNSIPIPIIDNEKISIIIKIMDKLQTIIEQRTEEIHKLDELIKARFVELFGNPEHNNKGWPVKKLNQLCNVGSSKRVYQEEQTPEGVPFWRISDLVTKMDTGNVESSLYISESKYEELKTQGLVPESGDILVTSRGTLGRCYIISSDDCFYFQDGMISWLSRYADEITPLYIKYLFDMPGFKKQIDGMQAGSTVAYLSIAMLKKLDVMLPNMDLQNYFSNFVSQIDKSKLRKKLNYITKNRLAS